MAPDIQSNTYWKHSRSGKLYRIIALAHREVDAEPCAVYREVDAQGLFLLNKRIWVRPLVEWQQEITLSEHVPTTRPRFIPHLLEAFNALYDG